VLTLLPSAIAMPRARRVLVLGAHSDDIEIGCGGTLLSWIGAMAPLEVRWVVFSAVGERETEARQSAADFLQAAAQSTVTLLAHRDGYFPGEFSEIKDQFEQIKQQFEPDIVLTHYREDRHQDHRVISDLTWNTWRDHLVLEYEIPKYDGDLGRPNLYTPISHDVAQIKIEKLMRHFSTQRAKRWFSPDTFLGLMRLRGIESGSPDGVAEAFFARKLLLGAGPTP
jgi:LmbE family N-acetylglucosaminyl deacetylase